MTYQVYQVYQVYQWTVYYLQMMMYYGTFVSFVAQWFIYVTVAANVIAPLFGGEPSKKEEVCQLGL